MQTTICSRSKLIHCLVESTKLYCEFSPVVEKFEGERETFTRVLSVYSDQMKAKDYRKLATSAKFRPLPAALEMSDPVEIEK